MPRTQRHTSHHTPMAQFASGVRCMCLGFECACTHTHLPVSRALACTCTCLAALSPVTQKVYSNTLISIVNDTPYGTAVQIRRRTSFGRIYSANCFCSFSALLFGCCHNLIQYLINTQINRSADHRQKTCRTNVRMCTLDYSAPPALDPSSLRPRCRFE